MAASVAATKTTCGNLYIIDMSDIPEVSNEDYNSIMIYQDIDTGFLLIRQLQYTIAMEIAMELFRTLSDYGLPTSIYMHTSDVIMMKEIEEYMEALSQAKHRIQFIRKDISDNVGTVLEVLAKMRNWYRASPDNNILQVACAAAQQMLNTTLGPGMTQSPEQLFAKK